jgi:hypothetical protein
MLPDLGFHLSQFLISFLVFSCSGGTVTELGVVSAVLGLRSLARWLLRVVSAQTQSRNAYRDREYVLRN